MYYTGKIDPKPHDSIEWIVRSPVCTEKKNHKCQQTADEIDSIFRIFVASINSLVKNAVWKWRIEGMSGGRGNYILVMIKQMWWYCIQLKLSHFGFTQKNGSVRQNMLVSKRYVICSVDQWVEMSQPYRSQTVVPRHGVMHAFLLSAILKIEFSIEWYTLWFNFCCWRCGNALACRPVSQHNWQSELNFSAI